ncbi:MAG: 3-dehydroquinate synthase, partial [Actinomycetota bacterium]
GVVGDLAGFVASTYARGLALVQVPTSLLAQVDASIGGKTAVNLAAGKNLVGTFHQPLAVVADIDTLATLPEEEFVSGMAEVIKYGLIAEPDLLGYVTGNSDALKRRDPAVLQEIVARSAAIKAGIVASDETEQGRRAYLNYGHTFAHAIEHLHGYGALRHGEAVALGMMAAASLARELGHLDDDDVRLHRRSLQALGLPVSAPLEVDDLAVAWQRDKKYRDGVRFVLLQRIGSPVAGIEADRDTIRVALERMTS